MESAFETHSDILAIVGFLVVMSTLGHTKAKRTKPQDQHVSASAFSNK